MDQPLTETVWVRRHWCDSLRAGYRLDDLTGLHWSDTRRSPHPMVHGYVMCHQRVSGHPLDSCLHETQNLHRIRVCVVAKDNTKALMTRLKAKATDNDRRRLSA